MASFKELWDKWDETVNRITKGRHDVKQMKSYFEERAGIEDAYSKALEKASKNYKEFEEKTSVSHAWNSTRNTHAQTSKQHAQLSVACREIAKVLDDTALEIKNLKLKNLAAHKRLLTAKLERQENHAKCKKSYYESVKIAETATLNMDAGRTQNLPDNQLQKLERAKVAAVKKVEITHEEYKKSVLMLQEAQATFDDKVSEMLDQFEQIERKRLKIIQEQGKRWSTSNDFMKSAFEQMAVLLHEGADAARADEDIQDFLKANKTGQPVPEHITYVPCVSVALGHMVDMKGGGIPPPAAPTSVRGAAPASPPPARQPEAAFAQTLYEFQSKEADDLPFPAGVLISLIHTPEAEDWWQGEYQGRRGMFPKTYCQALTSEEVAAFSNGAAAPKDAPRVLNARCEALYNFQGQDPDDLSFKAGDVLIITGELDGWYLGKNKDGTKTGIFPSNYVKVLT